MSLILALCLLQDAELEELARKIDADPQNAELRVQRARLLFRAKRPEDAMKDVAEAIRLAPKSAEAHLLSGQIQMALGRADEANESWERALKLNPGLRKEIDEMRRPRRRDEDEIARVEEALRDPNLPDRERDRLRKRLEELRRSRPNRPFSPPTREEIDEAREWLKANDPAQAARLEDLLTGGGDSHGVGPMVMEALARKREIEEFKRRDPEGYAKHQKMRELERRTFELSDQIRRGGHGSEELRKQLAESLAQLFDLREEQRAKELADLKRRVEELEKILHKRKESRASILERRMKELLGEKSDEDW